MKTQKRLLIALVFSIDTLLRRRFFQLRFFTFQLKMILVPEGHQILCLDPFVRVYRILDQYLCCTYYIIGLQPWASDKIEFAEDCGISDRDRSPQARG